MVCHTSALSCMAKASSKQAHHQELLHHLVHMERATHNAGQEICQRSTLAGATRGQSAILPTGAGSQAVVESTQPRPGHALHQWPRSHHSMTS